MILNKRSARRSIRNIDISRERFPVLQEVVFDNLLVFLVQRVPLFRVHVGGSVGAFVISHESPIYPRPVFTNLLLFRRITSRAGGRFLRRWTPPGPTPGSTEDDEAPPLR